MSIKITIEGWKEEPVIMEDIVNFTIVAKTDDSIHQAHCTNVEFTALAAAMLAKKNDDGIKRVLSHNEEA